MPAPPPPTTKVFVVVDEAHYMQTLTSKRTAAALALLHSPSCLGCVLATGTPMKNAKPCNLFPLLLAAWHEVARDQARQPSSSHTRFFPGC